jgi:hypothetical protein
LCQASCGRESACSAPATGAVVNHSELALVYSQLPGSHCLRVTCERACRAPFVLFVARDAPHMRDAHNRMNAGPHAHLPAPPAHRCVTIYARAVIARLLTSVSTTASWRLWGANNDQTTGTQRHGKCTPAIHSRTCTGGVVLLGLGVSPHRIGRTA